jgi:hypothetical protein
MTLPHATISVSAYRMAPCFHGAPKGELMSLLATFRRPLAVAIALLLGSRPTLAQQKEVVPVVIEGDHPGMRIDVEHDEVAVAACATPCSLRIPPGKYWLYVHGEDEETVKLKTKIRGGERLVLVSPNETAKWTGLAVGMGGAVAGVIGGVLLFGLAMGNMEGCGSDCESRPPPWVVPTTVATLVVGSVATPIGWTMFANNRKMRMESTPLDAERSGAPSAPTLSLAPIRGGAMLSGALTF